MRIVILGSGNVAEALAAGFTLAGNPPVQIFARNRAEGEKIAGQCGCEFTCQAENIADAGLYIVCVTDKSVRAVADRIGNTAAVVAHTAASLPIAALPERFPDRAVLYPLQTFTKGRDIEFSDIPFLIEGSTGKALETVWEAAKLLSEDVRESDFNSRSLLHAAAVFASNFTNYMYTVGEELATQAGFDFRILKPLIRETAAKAADSSSPVVTQTGPAIRNDFQTKSLHCELLREKPDLKNIYINLSKNIWETSKKISQK